MILELKLNYSEIVQKKIERTRGKELIKKSVLYVEKTSH